MKIRNNGIILVIIFLSIVSIVFFTEKVSRPYRIVIMTNGYYYTVIVQSHQQQFAIPSIIDNALPKQYFVVTESN